MYANPTQETPMIKQQDANKNRELMQLANLINYNSGGSRSGQSNNSGGGGGGLAGIAEQFMGEGSLLGGGAAGLGSLGGSSGSGALTGAGGSLAGTGGSALTGGSTAGGSVAGGEAAGGIGAGGWAAALAALIYGNEKQALDKGARDQDESQYWEDLLTGEVLQDDIRYRWGDKVFGDNKYGFGGDTQFGVQLSQGDFQEAWDTLRNESTLARLFGRKPEDDGKHWTEY